MCLYHYVVYNVKKDYISFNPVVIVTNLLLAEALPEKRMRMNTESEIQVPGPRLFACW